MDVSRTLARETEVNLEEIDEVARNAASGDKGETRKGFDRITLTLDINELCVLNLGGEVSKEVRLPGRETSGVTSTPHGSLRVKIRVIGVTRERSSRRDGGAL